MNQMNKSDKYAQAKEEITAIYHENKGGINIVALLTYYSSIKFL